MELTQAQAIEKLGEFFREQDLLRPMRTERYEAGTRLSYDIRGVFPDRPARVTLEIDRFVGGGFAGQVYRVRMLEIDAPQGPVGDLAVGGTYAMKILKPPSRMAQRFRDAVYAIGFQAPFTIAVNPAAARAGALWQKFIRRAAGEKFGTERAVCDIHATFTDTTIGACGEISEWIEGRTWRYEVDDRLEDRRRWRAAQPDEGLGSPEYRGKKAFMDGIVDLLHAMGAPELARQYEWWTCKSQPNCLKRRDCEDDPRAGLTAVDFRAGLALLPLLPMSPGDIPLIVKGLLRGSLVQFDRPNLDKLKAFVAARPETFAGMDAAMEELLANERIYRNSMPDITHNHVRLLASPTLWKTMIDSAAEGYRVRGVVDEKTGGFLKGCRISTLAFFLLGVASRLAVLGGVAIAVLFGLGLWLRGGGDGAWWLPKWPWPAGVWALAGGLVVGGIVLGIVRACIGRGDLRRHWGRLLTSPGYILRTLRGRLAERHVAWVRAGRMGPDKAVDLTRRPVRAFLHIPLSILPIFLHRMLTDGAYAKARLHYLFVRPIRLYFDPAMREQWLRDMVAEGQRRHMLTDADARTILSRIKEPFIQKYLKSLAVHVCTLPVTQVVALGVAVWWAAVHDLSWGEAWTQGLIIMGIFQLVPISPGSFVRGAYVLYLVIRERNFKDYNIAVFLGFFKYVGYLAFPIQMAYRYPALARFMAAHWATGAVHVVPVFGEHGALLEHWVFDGFYNYPLTLRRRMRDKDHARRGQPVKSAQAMGLALLGAVAVGATGWIVWRMTQAPVTLKGIWPAVVLTPLIAGAAAALLAGGMGSGRRIALGAVAGALTGACSAAAMGTLAVLLWPDWSVRLGETSLTGHLLTESLWALFLFSLLGLVGGAIAETRPLRRRAPRSSAVPVAEPVGK